MAISAHEEDLYFRVFNVSLGLPLAAQVRVAGTSGARRRGLMGLNELAEGAGIWIAPCEAIHTFGMKIPIDVIFLDDRLRVRKLLRNLTPARISICMRAHSVLELRSGLIGRSGTKVGDLLEFERVAADCSSEELQPMSSSPTCPQP